MSFRSWAVRAQVVLFALFAMLAGAAPAKAEARDDAYAPFDSSYDFIEEHFKAELRMELAVKLINAMDQAVASVVSRLKSYDGDIQRRVQNFNQAAAQWQDTENKFKTNQSPSREDLETIAGSFRVFINAVQYLDEVVTRYERDLTAFSGMRVFLADPFSRAEELKVDKSGGYREKWRRARLLSAVTAVRAELSILLPGFFSVEPIRLRDLLDLLLNLIDSTDSYIHMQKEMTFSFSEDAQLRLREIETGIDELSRQRRELESHKVLMSILRGKFFKDEKTETQKLRAAIQNAEKLISSVSSSFQSLASQAITVSENTRAKLAEALPKRPEDPWVLSQAQIQEFSQVHRHYLLLANRVSALGLVHGKEARRALRSDIQGEQRAWRHLVNENNQRWANEGSEYAAALEERLSRYSDHWNWVRFKNKMALDFGVGLAKLTPAIRAALDEGRIEEAALIYLSIQGAKILALEIPETERTRSLNRSLARADQLLSELADPIREKLSAEKEEELWYVFGDSPIFSLTAAQVGGGD